MDASLRDMIRTAFRKSADEQADAVIATYESLYASVPEGMETKAVEDAIRLMTENMVKGLETQNRLYKKSLDDAFKDKDKIMEAIKNAGK